MENKNRHSQKFLLICLTGSLFLIYFIIQPFLEALILSAVFAFIFSPLYQKILRFSKNRKSLAAFLTTIIAIFTFLLPITFLGIQIFKESSQLYQELILKNNNNSFNDFENATRQTLNFLPIVKNIDIDISQYSRQALGMLAQNLGNIFSSFARITLKSFIFLIAFYFLTRDGHRLKNYFKQLSPLNDKDDEMILERLKSGVSATITGNLSIGVIQGALTGIGFFIFGVPNPALWGGVASITALIPGIGTALVIIPAIIFLFVTGNIDKGIGLLAWGSIAVGMIDNFLGPKLVGGKMKLHPLVVLISVLGGIMIFGPLGFLLGPLAMSLFLVLSDIYFSLVRKSIAS